MRKGRGTAALDIGGWRAFCLEGAPRGQGRRLRIGRPKQLAGRGQGLDEARGRFYPLRSCSMQFETKDKTGREAFHAPRLVGETPP